MRLIPLLLLFSMVVLPALADGEPAGRLRAMAEAQVAAVAEALAGDEAGAQPTQFHLTLEGALLHHATSLAVNPSGIEREDAALSFFRIGPHWTKAKLDAVGGDMREKLSVHALDVSPLTWDGRHLAGTVKAQVGRINPRKDYGEGENMHSMLKARRRSTIDWHIGGTQRVYPSEQVIRVDAAVVPGEHRLQLTLTNFAGAQRPPRPPQPTDTTRMRPRDADQLFASGGDTLYLMLTHRDGQWSEGEGRTPSWNKAIHVVDASKLTLKEDRLVGSLRVTLMPDPWVPGSNAAGRRTREIVCQVDLPIRFGVIEGSYTGKGDQGEQEGDVTGSVWQSVRGHYVTDGVDGRYEGRVVGRLRASPHRVADLPAMQPRALVDVPDVKVDATVREAMAAYRQLHVARLVLSRQPVSRDEQFHAALHMPLPTFASNEAKAEYLRDLERFAALACADDAGDAGDVNTPAVGNVSSDDGDFGPFLGVEPLAGDAELPRLGDAGVQQWAMPTSWRVIGPIEHGRATGWHPSLLPMVMPTVGVTYHSVRPRFDGVLPLKYDWQNVEPTNQLLRPAADAWRAVWVSMSEYGGYGEHPVNQLYYAHQNGARSHRWFAVTTLRSAVDQQAWIAVRARDGGRVWLNGRLVWDSGPDYDAAADSVLRVSLKEGENQVLVESGKYRISYRPPGEADRSQFMFAVCVKGQPRDEATRLADAKREAAEALADADLVRGYYSNAGRQFDDAVAPLLFDVERGQNVVWRKPVGAGASAPVPVGGRVLVTVEPHHLICLDSATGRELWRRSCDVLRPDGEADDGRDRLSELRAAIGQEQALDTAAGQLRRAVRAAKSDADRAAIEREMAAVNEQLGALRAQWKPVRSQLAAVGIDAERELGARAGATPVTDGQRVWVVFGTGMAACFTLDGELVWQTRTGLPWTGGTEYSPYLVDGQLLVTGTQADADDPKRTLHVTVALDAATGGERWRGKPIESGPGRAVVLLRRGEATAHCIVTPNGTVMDGRDGRVLYRELFDLSRPIQPIASGSVAYLTATNQGQAAIRFWLDDAGRIGARKLWQLRRAGWSSPQETEAPIVHEGLLYIPRSADENAGHHPVAWDQLDVYETRYGQHLSRPLPVVVDSASPLPVVRAGNLIVYSDSGTRGYGGRKPLPMITFLRTGERPTMIQRITLPEGRLQAAPVFDGHHMLLRLNGELVRIGSADAEQKQRELAVVTRNVLAEIGQRPRLEVVDVKPDPAFKAAADSPVSVMRPHIPPDRWLMTDPLPLQQGDALRGIDAPATFVAKPGTTIRLSDALTAAFRPAPDEVVVMRGMSTVNRSDGTFYTPAHGLDINAALDRTDARSVYFYTVVECPARMAMNVRIQGATVWLAGHRITDSQAMDFAPGQYPMLLRVDVSQFPPVGTIMVVPQFNPILSDAQAAATWLAKVKRYEPILREAAAKQADMDTGRRAARLLEALDTVDGQ